MGQLLRIHELLAKGNLDTARYMAQREAVREALLANRSQVEFCFRGRYYIVRALTSGGLEFKTRKGELVKPHRVPLMVEFLARPLD